MKKKHYLVYQTTNLLNGKIYIGQHQTDNLNDGYIGSGVELNLDIEKFGKDNFKREILFDFDSFEEMDNKERELVNEDFVARPDTYNLTVGEQGNGFHYAITHGLNNKANNCSLGGKENARLLSEDKEYRELVSKRVSIGLKRVWKDNPNIFRNFHCDWTGRHHTEETKKKMSEKAKLRTGEKNSSYGSIWIYNVTLQENKKVKKELVNDFLNEGWMIGRKMEYYNK